MVTITAELGANHLGSLSLAEELVHAAAEAGADAVKFQAYDPELMCLDHSYVMADGPWKGSKLSDLYHEARTDFSWFPILFDLAHDLGLIPFASVFDAPSLAMLEALDCPQYKIASFELVDIPLLKMVAATGKPLILSTGMADYLEIQAAVYAVREEGCKDLTLLHCVSAYPADPEDVRLGNLGYIRESWSCHVGLSDHTLNNGLAAVAVSMGADMIEKHLTLDRSNGGSDAGFSLEPAELANLVQVCHEAQEPKAVIDMTPEEYVAVQNNTVGFGPSVSEAPSLKLRRSLYFTTTISAGTIIAPSHIQSARPAHGLLPVRYPEVIGKRLQYPVHRGNPVTEDSINLRGTAMPKHKGKPKPK